MKLESLKNGKFSSNVLSNTSMAMLHGGYTESTAQGQDSIRYYCCGNLYDKTETHPTYTISDSAQQPFPNTKPDWYTNE
jgi:hypothetical protein